MRAPKRAVDASAGELWHAADLREGWAQLVVTAEEATRLRCVLAMKFMADLRNIQRDGTPVSDCRGGEDDWAGLFLRSHMHRRTRKRVFKLEESSANACIQNAQVGYGFEARGVT